MSTYSQRLDRLANELQLAGIDAYFAWHPLSIEYLHGYGEDPGRRFMTLGINKSGERMMICPALAQSQAERAGIQPIRSWKDGEDPIALFKQLAEEWNLKSAIIAVDDETPAMMLLQMQKALPAALFQAGGPILGKLTRQKDDSELEALRKAGAIADQAFPKVLEYLKEGVTEAEMCERLFAEMSNLGGKPTFAVAAAGANGAEPHHLSDETPIKNGDVVVLDFGCTVDGYHSDITRTVCLGKATDEMEKVYETVYQAHMKARETIKSQVPAEQVDDAARSVISNAGYGDFFFHRTGHGIGRRIHEEPFIVAGNDQPLNPGECFSIEPGIYLKGKFGVRIENIVTVTEGGHESFNVNPSPVLQEVL